MSLRDLNDDVIVYDVIFEMTSQNMTPHKEVLNVDFILNKTGEKRHL